jgi:hypothetical protein
VTARVRAGTLPVDGTDVGFTVTGEAEAYPSPRLPEAGHVIP